MNEQAFKLLMAQLERHFDDDLAFQKIWKEHSDLVEEKLNRLFIFKWSIIGGAAVLSGLTTLVLNGIAMFYYSK